MKLKCWGSDWTGKVIAGLPRQFRFKVPCSGSFDVKKHEALPGRLFQAFHIKCSTKIICRESQLTSNS